MSSFVSVINKISTLPIMIVCIRSISNLFFKELSFTYAISSLLGFKDFVWLVKFVSSIIFSWRNMYYLECSLSDIPEWHKLLWLGLELLLRKLRLTCHDRLSFLVFLMKLTASLPYPLLFSCNPWRLNSWVLMLLLSMIWSYSLNNNSLTFSCTKSFYAAIWSTRIFLLSHSSQGVRVFFYFISTRYRPWEKK